MAIDLKSTADTKKPRRRQSIFRKILTGHIALTLLIVGLTALVSFFFVRDYSIRTNQSALRQKVEALAEMMARPGGNTWLLTPGRREEILALADANLVVIYPQMRVRQFMPSIWPEGVEDATRMVMQAVDCPSDMQILARLLAGETIAAAHEFDFLGDEVVFAGAPVFRTDDTVSCAVLLYRPLRKVADSTQSIALMHGAAGVATLLIAIILAYFIGRMLSNPLVEMSRIATNIAAGSYGEQANVYTSDEVGQMGIMLNTMSTKLATVIRNLDTEKSKLGQILASIGDGIVAVDRLGCVVHRNPAAVELLNLGNWEPDALEQRTTLISMLNECMEMRERSELTFELRQRTIRAVCSPILSDDGGAYGAVCLLHDISEMQRLEKMRRDYIANISHELRTPLTGIRGMVEPLMDGYIETDAERQDCYCIIYQETLRLERLIGEMLDLSRLQEGRSQIELEPMDAVALINAAIRRAERKAKEAGIELLQEDDGPMIVMGNENRIIQVLIILLDNAISFTKPGGRIVLGARVADDGFARISVADTGAGIAPEDMPYIWERFFKADRSRMRTKGVGLGLPIAKLIVGLMGGTICAKSNLGEGTEFSFTLKMVVRGQSF